jgi:hypothetical protein
MNQRLIFIQIEKLGGVHLGIFLMESIGIFSGSF